ncbi:MAG: hypothetical protein A7315_07505 [Candidatus Altiarchaeales archaeon WOR_SM1_79]|nr:MAG: hypothetical protein A7315_07505 [Candidatus Altiarchaeales archaeon WOR_SM1_79]
MVLSILRIIFGLLLTLFIPGFAITLVVFPKEGRIEKIALSCVLSIATVLLMALFLDLVLGIDITAESMVIALLSFSIFFFLIYIVQNRKRINLTGTTEQRDSDAHLMAHIDEILEEKPDQMKIKTRKKILKKKPDQMKIKPKK